MSRPRIFLLSPAHCGGKRAAILLRPDAVFDLAQQLRSPIGAPLGDVFSFLSGLYFRGKMAYASRFSQPPPDAPPALVITTNRGLLRPEVRVGPAELQSFGVVTIDPRDDRYRVPLLEDVARVAAAADCDFVLLGSIANPKYVALLTEVLGERLLFPEPFPGMGDMQRGALMLRSARSGEELPYLPVMGAVLSRARSRA